MTQATIGTKAPFVSPSHSFPGSDAKMMPRPDLGEATYKGSWHLADKRAIITGGDSGSAPPLRSSSPLGSPVSSSPNSTRRTIPTKSGWVEKAGRKCVLVPGDLSRAGHCRAVVDQAMAELGGLDILVNTAAYQEATANFEDVTIAEWDKTFQTNINALFYIL